MQALEPTQRTIVALDVESRDHAIELIEQLSPHVGGYAIGHIGIAEGWDRELIEMLCDRGKLIFYDAHLNATPRITSKAVRAYARWGITHLSICGTAGEESVRAAVSNRGDMNIVVRTILTSFSENDVRWEYGRRCEEVVLRHAQSAATGGAQAILCSPQELEYIRGRARMESLVKIVNGIRFTDMTMEEDDLQRVMAPAGAIRAGADYLLVGRPIVDPPSGTPLEAVERIVREIAALDAAAPAAQPGH